MRPTRARAAVLGGAAAVLLGLAPAAEAQRPLTSLRTAGTTGIPTTRIPAGTDFVIRTTVVNRARRGSRGARGARIFASLRRTNQPVATLPRVGSRALPIYRPGRRSRYSMRIRISDDHSGPYFLVLCVTQNGRKADCNVARGITVLPKQAPAAQPPAAQPTPPEPQPAANVRLRNAITQGELLDHARTFQAIADANGGTRAAGTPGYDASMAYVMQRLTRAGYSPVLDRFDYIQFVEHAPAQLTTNRGSFTEGTDYTYATYSGDGDTGTRAVVPVDVVEPPSPSANGSTSGCQDADFAGFPAGAIALVQRGACTFRSKAQNAAEAGASGVIIYNEGQPGRQDLLNGTLGAPPDPEIPVLGTTYALGQALLAPGSTARIVADTDNIPSSSYNVLADTPGGDPESVVVIGGHLDSVTEGPGINDNGSGIGTVLELAEQLAALRIGPVNTVRFAFWGAEEAGLVGSTDYVATRTDAELRRMKLNINFDMLASPNHIRMVYDGDGDAFGVAGPAGSDAIEAAFEDAFGSMGLASAPTEFSGRSDYGPFLAAGIPAGGLFSGAEGIKTAEQAAIFGGTAGLAYDPCYHQACDDIENLDLVGWEQMSDAAADVLVRFALQPDLIAAGPRRAASTARFDRSTALYWGKRLVR